MSRGLRIVLAAAGVLQILGIVACALLAIWDGDERWGATAFVLFISAAATLGVATFPGLP